MSAQPKIELNGVKKRFGPKIVLDGIDLAINKGDSIVIIGGSGSGKSVTIKCVLGIIKPDAGSIKVDGEEVTRLSGAKRDSYLRKFGMLFQGAALFDSLTVAENVGFVLQRGRNLTAGEIGRKVNEALEMVDLAGTQPKKPSGN